MGQKIVSTFMFSEPHEQELLWLKFNVENDYIDKWIITESTYTFQGQQKPLYLADILLQERFKQFRDKIHLIKIDKNYNFEYEISFIQLLKRKIKRLLNANMKKNYELVPYAENASFHAEIIQRQECLGYIRNNYSFSDIVIPCDADEIFDFGQGKINILNKMLLDNPNIFYIRREIFCYDFDNITSRLRYSPICRVRDLIKDDKSMHIVRHPLSSKRIVAESDRILAFEYTFCFSKEAILKKLSTFAHVVEINSDALDFCLNNNIALVNPTRIDKRYRLDKESYYAKIVLDSENSPEFLLHNIVHFRTNTVSSNYIYNRKHNNIE